MKKLLFICALSTLTASILAMDMQKAELKNRTKADIQHEKNLTADLEEQLNCYAQYEKTGKTKRIQRAKDYVDNDLNRELPQYWPAGNPEPRAIQINGTITAIAAASCGLLCYFLN